MTDPEILALLAIAATAVSPLIAVQVTRLLDDRNEKRGRKLQVYRTLMATRAYLLSPAHVEALNRIDLEFSPNKKAEKAIIENWQQYLDHLSSAPPGNLEVWGTRRNELLVDLLHGMGIYLGYEFSKTQVKNGTYLPTKHTIVEEEQEQIRVMVHELLDGKRVLPVSIDLAAALGQQQEQP